MARRRRRQADEINLTPLLDVLFSILFIAMLAGAQNEKNVAEQKQTEIDQLNEAIVGMEGQLAASEARQNSLELYHTEAVVLSMVNTSDGGSLVLYEGADSQELERIPLGANSTERLQRRLTDIVTGYLEATDNQPIYIVFTLDRQHIRTSEFRAIESALDELQLKNKEVFWKIMEPAPDASAPTAAPAP